MATQSSVLGGELIGVHPGDTVDFTASGLPTAGLQNIPALGKLVDSLLSPLLGQFQVVVHTGANFPGGARSVTLGGPASGPCKGVHDLPVTFPANGTYNFTWNVQYVLPVLLGCKANGVSAANLNLLKSVGVALNASLQWVGQIVVANDPPKGGLGLQLPGIKVAPSLPVVGQLPTITVPEPQRAGLGNPARPRWWRWWGRLQRWRRFRRWYERRYRWRQRLRALHRDDPGR